MIFIDPLGLLKDRNFSRDILYFASYPIKYFPEGEWDISTLESFRDKRIYILESFGRNPHQKIFELALFIKAAKQSQAQNIKLVATYFPYIRQVKSPGEELSTFNWICDTLTSSGLDHLIILESHINVVHRQLKINHLSTAPILAEAFRHLVKEPISYVIVPDQGRALMGKAIADSLKLPLIIAKKERTPSSITCTIDKNLLIPHSNALLIDDLLVTGKTIKSCYATCKENSLSNLYLGITHYLPTSQVFKDPFFLNFPLKVATNTIPLPKSCDWKGIDISPIIVEYLQKEIGTQCIF